MNREPGTILPRSFYARPAIDVAPELVGKLLVRRLGEELLSGWIVEVEAYMGSQDPASHAYGGPTQRNHSMFGPPGHLYVYRSYGVHFCANVVTSEEGVGTAVLLRALEPESGIDQMRRLRDLDEIRRLCRGPGNLGRALGISRSDDGADLIGSDIFIIDRGSRPEIGAATRIGINVAAERPWRFAAVGSRFVSRPLHVPSS